MADIITRLIMNSDQYSGSLEKAQKSLDKYIQKNLNLGTVAKGVTSTLGKMAIGLGAAATAGEALNKIMSSSQAKGDAMAETMKAARTTIDQFFYALGAGEFSPFIRGLDKIIDRAIATQKVIDQLGNTQISHRYFSSKNEGLIAKGQTLAKNKFAPVDEANKGFDMWREGIENQQRINVTLQHDTIEAVKAILKEEIGWDDIELSMQDLDKILSIDVKKPGERDRLKERYKKEYEAFRQAASLAENMYQHFDERGNILLEGDISGLSKEYKIATDEERKNAKTQLFQKYRDAILVNAGLNKLSDEGLTELSNMGIEYQNLNNRIESQIREFNETANEYNNRNKGIKGFNPITSLEGYKVYTGSGTGSAGVGAGNKKELGVEVGYVERDLKIKTAIERTSDNKLSDEIFKAIQGDKKLPVLMQPVQELIEGGMNEGPEEVEDPALEGLRDRIGMYDTIQQKIASYKDMLKYANEEEASYIQSQIAMWEEYANKIGSTAKEGDDLSAITGAIGQIGGALSSTGNDWLSYIGNSMSAVAQMIQVIQALTSAKSAAAIAEQATLPFPENLAAIASTIAALTSAMSSISSIGNFAEGGIVGGTNYQDGITARVSSGEMFINQADQKKLYDSIHSGNIGGGSGRAVVTGEQIVIAANNWGKRTGRGEILFAK